MRIRRVAALLKKELYQSSKSFFLLFAIIGPLCLTLFVNLLFKDLFAGLPELGILDEGHSGLVEKINAKTAVNTRQYRTKEALEAAVAAGARDIGIVLPAEFDAMLAKKQKIQLIAYTWGESLLKDRAIIITTLVYSIRELTGFADQVEIVTRSVGNEKNIPWEKRLLPLIVLMAIFMSGLLIPSASLVEEKETGTLVPVLTSPVTQAEIFLVKGLVGFLFSFGMGILILILNNAFTAHPGLITLFLAMGALLAACTGLIYGAFLKTVSSVFASMKGIGILLYAPGLLSIFPEVPGWISWLFPTHYVIHPLMQITQQGKGWSGIAGEFFVLLGIILVMGSLVLVISGKTQQQAG